MNFDSVIRRLTSRNVINLLDNAMTIGLYFRNLEFNSSHT